MTIDLFLSGLLQGLLLALIAYAVMIPFRLLNFPDLTAEGAYPLGGAICASALLLGMPSVLAIVLATVGAGCLGIATSLVYLRLQVNTLLAGIILSTMVYSINLRILTKPNVALFEIELFTPHHSLQNMLILFFILLSLLLLLALFLRTEFGLKFRATGLNADFARQQAICVTRYTILGLFLANCLSGLAGGLMVQLQHYMDVGMGVGIVIHGLAALMLGEALIGNHTLQQQLIAPFIGALVYQQIQGLALAMGLAPSDLKFFTGALVLLVIAFKRKVQYARP